jgi:hypothetical protein
MGGMLGGQIDPSLQRATMEVDYLAHCQRVESNNDSRCDEYTPRLDSDTEVPTTFSSTSANGGSTSILTLLILFMFASIKQYRAKRN